jgi:hypothetical protein
MSGPCPAVRAQRISTSSPVSKRLVEGEVPSLTTQACVLEPSRGFTEMELPDRDSISPLTTSCTELEPGLTHVRPIMSAVLAPPSPSLPPVKPPVGVNEAVTLPTTSA